MVYKTILGSHFGFADLSIRSVVGHLPGFFQGVSMLITCLDSTTQLTLLGKWIDELRATNREFRLINGAVWIAAHDVMGVVRDPRTFTGFDEVYLLKGMPPLPLSLHGTYTTDGVSFQQAIPEGFLTDYHYLGAVGYLAGGCGLNFGCEAASFVERIGRLELLMASNTQ